MGTGQTWSNCGRMGRLNRNQVCMFCYVRTQLLGQLRASGFVRARGGGDIRDLNSNSENWAVVKAAMCAGLYPNILRVDRERNQLTSMYVVKSSMSFCSRLVWLDGVTVRASYLRSSGHGFNSWLGCYPAT